MTAITTKISISVKPEGKALLRIDLRSTNGLPVKVARESTYWMSALNGLSARAANDPTGVD
jgi:hypothetical protein